MTARSKAKGQTFERDVQRALNAAGFDARRVPNQGGMPDAYDLDIAFPRHVLRGEAKIRARGFTALYGWLTDADLLFIRADRKPALVCLPLETFLALVGGEA
jgi:hypothetical protein